MVLFVKFIINQGKKGHRYESEVLCKNSMCIEDYHMSLTDSVQQQPGAWTDGYTRAVWHQVDQEL